jgi:hypothetical protein
MLNLAAPASASNAFSNAAGTRHSALCSVVRSLDTTIFIPEGSTNLGIVSGIRVQVKLLRIDELFNNNCVQGIG